MTTLPLYISSQWCSRSLQALFESLIEVKKTKTLEQDTNQGFIEHISLKDAARGISEVGVANVIMTFVIVSLLY